MNLTLEDLKNGWFGVDIGLAPSEIDQLVHLLRMIQADPEQHFHLNSDYTGNTGVGQITFFVEDEGSRGNGSLSSLALAPGTEIGGGGV